MGGYGRRWGTEMLRYVAGIWEIVWCKMELTRSRIEHDADFVQTSGRR